LTAELAASASALKSFIAILKVEGTVAASITAAVYIFISFAPSIT
jgi:hypothetical protein